MPYGFYDRSLAFDVALGAAVEFDCAAGMTAAKADMPQAALPDRQAGRRGRPSRVEVREITERIVEAALKLFLAEGYGATSMKRICEESGVASNTLYARFPDKAALFRAIIQWKAASWKVTNPPRRARAGAGLAEVLEVAALGMLEAMEREDIGALGRLLAYEADRFPELAQIYFENAMTIGRDELVERIAHAPDSDLSGGEVLDLVTTLTEVVVGHSGTRMFQGLTMPQATRRATARRIGQVIARGWTVREAKPSRADGAGTTTGRSDG